MARAASPWARRCGARSAARIAALVGAKNPLAPQVVTTARAHLYQLAREGLLEAAWLVRDVTAEVNVSHHRAHDNQ